MDTNFVDRAVRSANVNALRIALLHQTEDQRLAAMEIKTLSVRGGAFMATVLARHDQSLVRELAVDYLRKPSPTRPAPDRTEAAELMKHFTGQALSDSEIAFGYEDLAFAEFPRDVGWTNGRPDAALRNFSVTIIGAGLSGIAAAVLLDRLGISYRILERMDDVGGTWHLNDYPDARVDITSFLYQYRFVKNYPWKSYFATQPEVKEYVRHVVETYGIGTRIELNTSLVAARWDDATQRWILTAAQPHDRVVTFETNVVISGTGLFSTPNLPDIQGIETFAGAMFHTTAWDHQFDYRGKSVALIGTGSTGSQLMPALAREARSLAVFQRTANWVTPLPDYHAQVSAEHRWLLDTMPGYWNWYNYSTLVNSTQTNVLQELDHDWIANGGRVNERNEMFARDLRHFIRSKVGDRDDLFEKLLPNHPPLARRLVVDNGFYDSLLRENVELVTDSIDRINEHGIVTKDGRERRFDLIVLGAGFKVSQYLWPVPYVGRNGVTLEDLWAADGARAYKGVTMPGFPNFFMFYGPNSQARGGGFHTWAELVARYICASVVDMVERGATSIEVRQDAFATYNAALDEANQQLLWETEGRDGYFVNQHGRVGTQMPWRVPEFFDMIRTSEPESYVFTGPQ